MKKSLLTFLLAIAVNLAAKADLGGPDPFGYIWRDNVEPNGPTYNWVDITTRPDVVAVTGLSDDNNLGPFALPAAFRFYWYDVSSFWIGSNGYIAFEEVQLSSPFPSIPNLTAPNNFIAPMGSDLNFAGLNNPGRCYYWTSNDSLIVTWQDVPFWRSGATGFAGSNTFQVILSRLDSSITFQYKTQTGTMNTVSLSAGIENVNGDMGLQTRLNPTSPYFITPYAVKFYYPSNTTFQVIDASASWNNNPTNGARFVSNNTTQPWQISGSVRNTGNVNLNAFNVVGYVADNAFGTSGPIRVSDTTQTGPLAQNQTAAVSVNNGFSPTQAGTYLQVTKTLYPGDISTFNDSSVMELIVVDTTGAGFSLLSYDDDSNDGGLGWDGGGGGVGVEFVPPYYPCKIYKTHAYVVSDLNAVGFSMVVYDDDGLNNGPGSVLDSVFVDGNSYIAPAWVDVNLSTPVTLNSGSFYVAWIMGGASINIGQDIDPPYSNRTYEVLAGTWAIYRARAIEDLMVNATIGTLTADLNEAENNKLIGMLYPNPTNNTATIRLNAPGKLTASIYSIDGRLISAKIIDAPSVYDLSIDVSAMETGLYNIVLSGNKVNVSRRLVVTK